MIPWDLFAQLSWKLRRFCNDCGAKYWLRRSDTCRFTMPLERVEVRVGCLVTSSSKHPYVMLFVILRVLKLLKVRHQRFPFSSTAAIFVGDLGVKVSSLLGSATDQHPSHPSNSEIFSSVEMSKSIQARSSASFAAERLRVTIEL